MSSEAITLTPVLPAGPPVHLRIVGEALPSGGVGGFDDVDRPHRLVAGEWKRTPAWRLTMTIRADGVDAFGPDKHRSVEADVAAVIALGRHPSGRQAPPVFVIGGIAVRTTTKWQMDALEWGATIKDGAGNRVQQLWTLTVREYVPADVAFTSPAAAARIRAAAAGGASSTSARASTAKTYTVRKGDTLSSIAARQLGKAARWTEIRALNGLRDPNRLTVGQTLRLP